MSSVSGVFTVSVIPFQIFGGQTLGNKICDVNHIPPGGDPHSGLTSVRKTPSNIRPELHKIRLWIFNRASSEHLFLSAALSNSKHTSPILICSIVCVSVCVIVQHMPQCVCVLMWQRGTQREKLRRKHLFSSVTLWWCVCYQLSKTPSRARGFQVLRGDRLVLSNSVGERKGSVIFRIFATTEMRGDQA